MPGILLDEERQLVFAKLPPRATALWLFASGDGLLSFPPPSPQKTPKWQSNKVD